MHWFLLKLKSKIGAIRAFKKDSWIGRFRLFWGQIVGIGPSYSTTEEGCPKKGWRKWNRTVSKKSQFIFLFSFSWVVLLVLNNALIQTIVVEWQNGKVQIKRLHHYQYLEFLLQLKSCCNVSSTIKLIYFFIWKCACASLVILQTKCACRLFWYH